MGKNKWHSVILLLLLISCNFIQESTKLSTPTHSHEYLTLAASTPTPPGSLTDMQPGMAGFRDQFAVADQFFLKLENVPAPPGGLVYQGWLLDDDGGIFNIGILTSAADGSLALTWNSPTGENLLSRYAHFQISLEPWTGSTNPTGKVVFAGGLDGTALTNARRLLVKNDSEPLTPLNMAFARGLIAETDLAAQHIQNAINAAALGAKDEMRAHLEHVVNILEGMDGPRYGDHDGNGATENPGDGFGVLGYAGQITEILAEESATAETYARIQAQIVEIQDKCLEILLLDDLAMASSQLNDTRQLMAHLQNGLVTSLYQTVQAAIRFEVRPVE